MKRTAQFIFFFIISFVSLAQTQIGSDIRGVSFNDGCGIAVAISNDGKVVAAGASKHLNKGHVRVFEDINGTWTQIGSDMIGEFSNDGSGREISLSGDGTIVAIGSRQNSLAKGHVRVYKNINGTWTQIGLDIDGEAGGDWSGDAISLSYDGNIVAIGAYKNDGNGDNAGHVRVYKNISNSWTQIGSDIDGESAGDYFGYSVSLSDNGEVLAVGGIYNAGGGSGLASKRGHVRVYKNINNTWTQIGSDIDGESTRDYFGRSVSLSSNGKILAAGAIYDDGAATDAGHVRVYENINGSWIQLGADIDGKNADDRVGYSVSLSNNGKTLLIGAPFIESSRGQARIYKFSDSTWTQYGDSLNGINAGDFYGVSLGLSGDGSRIAIGGSGFDLPAQAAGHVQVFEICVNDYSIDTVSSCDSFTWVNGITYYESDTNSKYSFTNTMGCDSIVRLNLIVNKTKYSNDTVSSCYQYKWTNGITYTENNNTAKDTFESFWGCDSIVTLNLTINKSSEVNISVSVCDSFITPTGKTYYTSGTFVDTLINHLGCDSFLIYKLDVVKTDAIITQQPKDANHYVGETAKFSVKSDNYPKAFYQWQSDQGFGFQDLSNASQFSDVNTNTVSISDVRLTNDKQKFRCVIFEKDCSDTTNEVTLYVTDNVSVNNLINSDLVSVYPIPFNDELNIKISSLLVGSAYRLFDIRGAIIKSGIFNKETNRINLSNICKGTYYLDVDKLNKPLKVIK